MERWWKRAACLGHHEVVDAAAASAANRYAWRALRQLCQDCPVGRECIDDAVENNDWRIPRAGLTKKKLHELVSHRRRLNAR